MSLTPARGSPSERGKGSPEPPQHKRWWGGGYSPGAKERPNELESKSHPHLTIQKPACELREILISISRGGGSVNCGLQCEITERSTT